MFIQTIRTVIQEELQVFMVCFCIACAVVSNSNFTKAYRDILEGIYENKLGICISYPFEDKVATSVFVIRPTCFSSNDCLRRVLLYFLHVHIIILVVVYIIAHCQMRPSKVCTRNVAVQTEYVSEIVFNKI